MTHRIASCSCGQLTAKVVGEPIRVSVCHCYACQRRTGGVFASQARFAREAVEVSGSGTDYVRTGDEGGRARFTFCPTCGVAVYYVTEGREDSVVIPVGVFADSSFPAPTFSVYEDRMHAWVTMPPGIEHMA
jgi:hypothetical protein